MATAASNVIRFPLEERMADGPRLVPAEPATIALHPDAGRNRAAELAEAAGFDPIAALAKHQPKACWRCHGSQVVGKTMRSCPECCPTSANT